MSDDDHTQVTRTVALGRLKEKRPGRLTLKVVTGPVPGASFDMSARITTVGRSRVADVRVLHRSISGLHFELRPTADGAMLRDLQSKNGTWFHGRRVEAVGLLPGDQFHAGECRFELMGVDSVEVETLALERFGQLHGKSLVMRELYAQLDALGPTPLDVLILGETGTGKELIARTLHALSGRPGPIIVLDCSAFSPSLAESTLFGFRKRGIHWC